MNWWNTQIHKIHSVRVGRGKIPIAEVSLGGRIGVSDTKEYESRVYPVLSMSKLFDGVGIKLFDGVPGTGSRVL
jgi:hypothetical protein